jgi:threonine/homoserine/homoserine lactone efflux protein
MTGKKELMIYRSLVVVGAAYLAYKIYNAYRNKKSIKKFTTADIIKSNTNDIQGGA